MARLTDQEIAAGIADVIQTIGMPRCLFVRGVQDLAGLSYADAATRPQYITRLWPFDTPADAHEMARVQSSCGITTEVGWRFAGVDDPEGVLYLPYAKRVAHGGTWYAVSREMYLAQQAGAWVSGIPWRAGTPLPREGDALIIGCQSCGSSWSRGGGFGGEHEFTACLWGSDGLLHSIDGGQPGIAIRSRALLEVWTGSDAQGATGELWAGKVDANGVCAMGADGRPASGRRVMGFTNVDKLPRTDNGNDCGPGAAEGGESVSGLSFFDTAAQVTGLVVGAIVVEELLFGALGLFGAGLLSSSRRG